MDDVQLDLMTNYNVGEMQEKCPDCQPILRFLRDGILPNNDAQARKIVFQSERYFLIDGSLHHLHLPRNKPATFQ